MQVDHYAERLEKIAKPGGDNQLILGKFRELQSISGDLIKKLKFCIVLFTQIERFGMKGKDNYPALVGSGTGTNDWKREDWERYFYKLDEEERARAYAALKWLGEIK